MSDNNTAPEMRREFRGVWIPAAIWLDNNLSSVDKTILVEIDSLDGDDGCYARNEYLAKFCGCSEATVSRSLRKLKDLGYVYEGKFDGRTRVLHSRIKHVTSQGEQSDDHASSICKGGQDNLIGPYISNYPIESTNKEKDKESTSSTSSPDEALFDEVISYLNDRTGKSYRTSTKSTKAYIRTLLNQGFTVKDIKVVIDRKSRQWRNDPKMDRYLRPQTLFSVSNFEGYLNEKDCAASAAGSGRNQSQSSEPDDRFARFAKFG